MINRYRAPVKLSDEAVRKCPRWQIIVLLVIATVTAFFAHDLWTLREVTAQALASSMATHGLSGWLMPSLLNAPFTSINPFVDWIASALMGLVGPKGLFPILSDIAIIRLTADLLFLATLIALWFAARTFGKQNAVQPLTFAFGGEASPRDYVRALGDITVLLFIATAGILTRRHETIADTGMLFAASLNLWALAYSLRNPKKGALLAGASTALMLFTGTLFAWVSSLIINAWCFARIPTFGDERPTRLTSLALAAIGIALIWPVLSFLVAPESALHWWSAWMKAQLHTFHFAGFTPLLWLLRNGLWYTLPLWPLIMVAIVRWRRQRKEAELRIPVIVTIVTLVMSFFSGNLGNNQVFLTFIPALALLAAFGLVTLRGRHRAILDWFAITVSFLALAIAWSYWFAWKTGMPIKMAQSMTMLAPGTPPSWDAGFIFAVIATLIWCGLAAWRFTHRPPFVWTGAWLMAWGMTTGLAVWIGLFNMAVTTNRSYTPIAHSVNALFSALGGNRHECLNTVNVPRGLAAYLGQKTGIEVVNANVKACHFTLVRLDKRAEKMSVPHNAAGPIARPHTNEFFYLMSD